MVFLVLGLIWAAALLPTLIRHWTESNPTESIGKFNRHLRVLESATPAANALAGSPFRPPGAPMPRIWVVEARRLALQRRRRRVAKGLVVAAATSLVVGIIPGFHAALIVHGLVDVALVSYVVMLARQRRYERSASGGAHADGDQLASYVQQAAL